MSEEEEEERWRGVVIQSSLLSDIPIYRYFA